jgi:anaerobic magnesium-protoporphyrin IX monomethyl ester cyclase
MRWDMHNIKLAYTFCDYVIEGEGESIFPIFPNALQKGESVENLKQLWIKKPDGEIVYNGMQPLQNIDSIALPDFSDFDRSTYLKPDRLPILFSRGCILNCNYCTNKWNHISQRSRSGKLVFEELKRDVLEYGITEFMFNDDSLISYKTFNELETFCELAIAEDLVLPWSIYGTRIERKLTPQYIKKLRMSGMTDVALGVESFSTNVQHAMGKSSKEDDCDRVCRMFMDEGIRTESWIIYGYPTETDEDFEVTLN